MGAASTDRLLTARKRGNHGRRRKHAAWRLRDTIERNARRGVVPRGLFEVDQRPWWRRALAWLADLFHWRSGIIELEGKVSIGEE